MTDSFERENDTDEPLFFPIPSGFINYRPAREVFAEQRRDDPTGHDRDLAELSGQIAEVDRYHSPAAVAASLARLDHEIKW